MTRDIEHLISRRQNKACSCTQHEVYNCPNNSRFFSSYSPTLRAPLSIRALAFASLAAGSFEPSFSQTCSESIGMSSVARPAVWPYNALRAGSSVLYSPRFTCQGRFQQEGSLVNVRAARELQELRSRTSLAAIPNILSCGFL